MATAKPLLVREWAKRGACRAIDDLSVFFPEDEEDDTLSISIAKSVCQGCVVREDCLEWALSAREKEGIYGGLTWLERQRLSQSRERLEQLERRRQGMLVALVEAFRRGSNNQGRDWLLRLVQTPGCPSKRQLITAFGSERRLQKALAIELLRVQIAQHNGPLHHEHVDEWSRQGLVFSKTTLIDRGWSPGEIYRQAGGQITLRKRRTRNQLLGDFRRLCQEDRHVLNSGELQKAAKAGRCASQVTYYKYFGSIDGLVAEAFPEGFKRQAS